MPRENGDNGNGSTVGGNGGSTPGGVPGCPPGTHAEAIGGVWLCIPDAPGGPPPPGGPGGGPPLTCAADEHVEPIYGTVDGKYQQVGWGCVPNVITSPPPPPPPPPPGGGGGGGGGIGPPPGGFPGLAEFFKWLRGVLDAREEILRKLRDEVSEIAKNVGDAADKIRQQIAESLNKYLPQIGDAMNKLQANIAGLVQGLVPTTLALVGAALGGVETIAAAFLNNAASVDDIINAVTSAFGLNKETIGSFLAAALGAGFESGLKGFIESNPNGELTSVERALNATGVAPTEWGNPVNLLKRMQANLNEGDTVSKLMIWASVVWGMWGAFGEPVTNLSSQIANAAAQITPVSADEAAAASARNVIKRDEARAWAVRGGVGPNVFDVKEQLAQAMPPIELLTAAFFRGAIPEELYDYYLNRLGFATETASLIKSAMTNIPNVSDVLRFLVRDVFIPEFVEAFGMDKEYPQDADVWAAKLGIPHEVMVLHWRAHWDLPSISQGYEMFQRGKIDEIALRRLLRAQGVEPYWRDPLIAVSYTPLTRISLRQMDKIGSITDKQLLQGYRDIGYSPEQAQLLFDFTKKYNSLDKPKHLQDLTDGLKARVVTAILSGTLKEDEGRKLLVDIGYADAEITAFITEGRLLRQETISKKVMELIGDLYVKGHRTEAEARAALSEHGYMKEEIELILREWNLEKELKAPSEKVLAQRDLSASNVITAFIEGAMNEADAKKYLLYLRYDDKEAAVLVADAKFKREVAAEKETIDAIHVGVLSGRITEDAASAQLSAANINAKKRDALLAKWELERHGKTEMIPLSSLKDIFARQIWDEDHMTKYLRVTGYSDDDITVLLALWGSQTAERKAKEAAAAAKAAEKAAKKGGTG